MQYFDTHIHLLPPYRLFKLIQWLRRALPSHPVSENATVDEIVAELRQNGATYLVNLVFPLKVGEVASLHEFNAGLARRIPNLLPFAGVHPEDEDRVAQTVYALDELQLVGVKIHTMVQKVDPWDTRLHPVYAELNRRRRPLWLHTGYEMFYTFAFPNDHLGRLAEKFPDMPIVLAHAIYPHLELAFRLVAEHPNIYLDMTNVFGSLQRPSQFAPDLTPATAADLVEVTRQGIIEYQGRVVYGSDHPVGLGSVADMLADMTAMDIPEPARQAMLWDTPLRLFRAWAGRWLDEDKDE